MNTPLDSLHRAVARLGTVLSEPDSMTQREASIHCFESTFELGWKSIQSALKRKGIDAATPRDCLDHAWRLGWIDDEDQWTRMLRDRILSSHTYKESVADDVYSRLRDHLRELSLLADRLAKL